MPNLYAVFCNPKYSMAELQAVKYMYDTIVFQSMRTYDLWHVCFLNKKRPFLMCVE